MTLKFDDARIAAMLNGRRGVHRVPFPGLEGGDNEVGVRVLSGAEDDEARTEATRMFIASCERDSLDWRIVKVLDEARFDQTVERCIVARAIMQADADEDGKHRPFFQGVTSVAQMDPESVQALYDAYLQAKELLDPKAMPQEQQIELIETLKKTPSPRVWLLGYPRATLTSLFLTSIGRSES